MKTGWYKWESSKITLEEWLGEGNKVQEVCPEFISRISKLGGKLGGRQVHL